MARRKNKRQPKPLTDAESLDLLATITRVISAWEKHAPNKKFAGLSLEQLKKAAQPSFDANAEISRLEWEIERLKKLLDGNPGPPLRH